MLTYQYFPIITISPIVNANFGSSHRYVQAAASQRAGLALKLPDHLLTGGSRKHLQPAAGGSMGSMGQKKMAHLIVVGWVYCATHEL